MSKIRKFRYYRQLDSMDCGPTCLRMIADYYGRSVSMEFLRSQTKYGKAGVSMLGLSETAESLGFDTVGAKLTFEQLFKDAPLPAIIQWNDIHYVVLHPNSFKSNGLRRWKIKPNKIEIADPARGRILVSADEFQENWIQNYKNGNDRGIVLLFEAKSDIDTEALNPNRQQSQKVDWFFLINYLKSSKKLLLQVVLGLLVGSFFQLLFPYLTQSVVDTGIATQSFSFIQIILAAQFMLLISQTLIEAIRGRILLHISTRVNILLITNFWAKLLRLPLKFFDTKHPGDIIQRINDHNRIENFLTGTALSTFFSVINLLVLSIVLLSYNINVFIIFIVGSAIYFLWVRLFLKYRRQLDARRFLIASKENNASLQLVYGMQEIKLNNAEKTFRKSWERLQLGLFRINFKNLKINQYQQIGGTFLHQGKNLLITYLVASLVIEGSLTMGMMLAIQYIIGQLNAPVEQLITFSQQAQDAKISIDRLNDIHTLDDEEPHDKEYLKTLSPNGDLHLSNVSFSYTGMAEDSVLKNLTLTIPRNKVTAVVGASGSGKTTLLKLILRFYEDYSGSISIEETNFRSISPKLWRSNCAVVMQENFIFNDTIRKNITLSDTDIDEERLLYACKVANILTFIEDQPLGFHTKIGIEGTPISGGQKQRLCIARAVYKNAPFLLFDEATNSLDATNERIILSNLEDFFRNKTVIIVAHRLSTVKKADKIIVLENGLIMEEGNHNDLVSKSSKYFSLIKDQLELGQ